MTVTCRQGSPLTVTLNVSTIQMHIAQTSTMKCSLEQCFFSYAALTYEQHVSIFLFFFAVFIVSDLNDLIHMYTKIFVLFSYNVTINAYIGNTYNEIFKYYYTKNYSIIMFLFVMCTFLLFYTPLSLLSLSLLLIEPRVCVRNI